MDRTISTDRIESTRRTPGCGPASGFTIVELLVVVAVIALLLGILMPALGAARTAAGRTRELAAARELLVAWSLYANQNGEAVLPGYRSGLPATDQWGADLAAVSIPAVAARYPWRIAPYFDWSMDALYGGTQREVLRAMEQTDRANYRYVVSVSPSIGLNTTWVGGDENELGFSDAARQTYGAFYVRSLAQVFHPERLLVGASARGVDPLAYEGTVEGYFRVRSPRLAEGQPERWGEEWNASASPESFGHLSLRWGRTAVAGFVDGHVGVMGERDLRDMRHWSNRATKPDSALAPIDD